MSFFKASPQDSADDIAAGGNSNHVDHHHAHNDDRHRDGQSRGQILKGPGFGVLAKVV
jgi:hypothetical protein